MAAQRKRKHAAVEEPTAGKYAGSTKVQKRIKSFGHVSKPNEDEIIVEIEKMERPRNTKHQMAPAVQPVEISDKKRKRVVEEAIEEELDDDNITVSVDCRETITPSTPRNKRTKNIVSPSPARSAAALFDKLNINHHSSFTGFDKIETLYETPSTASEADDLSAFRHLQSMYASFLSAISLHYSHNGSSSPIGIQALLSMVTKHWQKRRVSLDDVRILLAICQATEHPFSLRDYGRAGICLSMDQSSNAAAILSTGRINEEELKSRFDGALYSAWQDWRVKTSALDRTVVVFLDQIQLPAIQKHESVDRAASIFTKGQQRLADIKFTSAATQLASSSKIIGGRAAALTSTQTPSSRGTALLDRILAKQNLSSTLSAGPTKAQLERKAALDRIEDIARVLCLLAGMKDRASFSMAIATQHLQQSLRNPISAAEVQRCLALMATEIVPEFVKVVMSQGVHGVVITRSGNVGLGEMRARLEKANR